MKTMCKKLSTVLALVIVISLLPFPPAVSAAAYSMSEQQGSKNLPKVKVIEETTDVAPEPNQMQVVAAYTEAHVAVQHRISDFSRVQAEARTAKSNLYLVVVQVAKRNHSDSPLNECPPGACDSWKAAVSNAEQAEKLAHQAVEWTGTKMLQAWSALMVASATVLAATLALAACALLFFPPLILACEYLAGATLVAATASLEPLTIAYTIALAAWAAATAAELVTRGALALAEAELANCLAAHPDCVSPQVCTPSGCKSPTPTPGPTATASSNGGAYLYPPESPEGALVASIAQSQGGVAAFDNDAIQVNLPPEAVTDTVNLVYMPRAALNISGFEVERLFSLEAYTGGCQWQKFTDFKKPVSIQVSFYPEQVAGINESQLGLYYFDNDLNQWVALQSLVDTKADRVTASQVDYFTLRGTLYALMAPARAAAR